jgi:hypothetical protein
MIDKNYFLDMMKNGEDIDTIAEDITFALNEAKAEMEAFQKKNALANRKLEIANEVAKLFREYADLTYPDAAGEIGKFEGEALVEIMDESFELLKGLYEIKNVFAAPAKKTAQPTAKKSDDDILSEFIKIFN